MAIGRTVSAAHALKRTNVRYIILALVFFITTLNYADRATLSVTGSAMRGEFGFDAIEMGYIFSAFSWSYVLCQVPAGWLLDRFGARRVYAASILLWSLFTLLQSTIGWTGSAAAAVTGLFILRFAMGAAEAPAFPANAKVVASWFPARERGTASAIFNSAQYFAAVVFTPLMAWITHAFGWHEVYVVMGVVGLVLSGVWLRFMKHPADHPGVSPRELEYIEQGGGFIRGHQAAGAPAPRSNDSWRVVRQLLGNRMLLGVYLAQFCINVLTYFFLTWFPIYLVQARHMTILQAGLVASLPAICGFGGGVLGEEFRQRGVVGQQQLAPALDQVQPGRLGLAGALEGLQHALDGFHLGVVELAHDLADELHLAALAFVVGDAARVADGVGQRFGHGHARQAVAGQRFELNAEVLQGEHVAFFLRLALGQVVFVRFGGCRRGGILRGDRRWWRFLWALRLPGRGRCSWRASRSAGRALARLRWRRRRGGSRRGGAGG